MRKLPVLAALALSVSSLNVNADALGFFVGGGIWNNDASGTFGTSVDLDVESDLNFGSEQDTYVWAAFEHFVPLVPNIRIEASSIGHTGNTANVAFNGTFVGGDTQISIDNVDTIFYYRLLDNWVNFDFGLNLRKLEADLSIGNEIVSVSETLPMLYLSAEVALPFSGFSVGGDINTVSYAGSTYQDIRIRAMYEIGTIGFEAGLKSTTIKFDDVDNINADLEFTGIMLGAFLHI